MLPKINTLKQYYLHKQELVYIRSWAVMWRTPLPNSSPYFGYFEVSADRHISSPWIWWHFCLCKGPRVRLEINILLSMKLTATESLLYRWTTRQSLFLFRCITELRRCNTHNSRNRSSKLFAHSHIPNLPSKQLKETWNLLYSQWSPVNRITFFTVQSLSSMLIQLNFTNFCESSIPATVI